MNALRTIKKTHVSILKSYSRQWTFGKRSLSTVQKNSNSETKAEEPPLQAMKPREVVAVLDRYICGQPAAKRLIAIALRNRYRRLQLDPATSTTISPKNILMVGPTGCGKTEIARRLAKLIDAPFIKVEATKFTEVGYHGKDVDSIIKDLVSVAVNDLRKKRGER